MIVGGMVRQGYRRSLLLGIAGLARSTYHDLLKRPVRVTRPDLDGLVAEVFRRTPNGCGHRQIHMVLREEFGIRVGRASVLKVMKRLGLECRIRRRNPRRPYSSYRGDAGRHVRNLLGRDFHARRPFEKMGTDVTEFNPPGLSVRVYLAIVYDMCSKEIVAWVASTRPDLDQQKLLLDRLEARLPEGADPILHSDMGWPYRHDHWRGRLKADGIRQSMSRKGNCLDNAATEQVFGHLKDEFYRGRRFDSLDRFMRELDEYIIHWNTRRRQVALGGLTPDEYRRVSLAA